MLSGGCCSIWTCCGVAIVDTPVARTRVRRVYVGSVARPGMIATTHILAALAADRGAHTAW
jgi:hypothetical protein